jgi:hypothetical protein
VIKYLLNLLDRQGHFRNNMKLIACGCFLIPLRSDRDGQDLIPSDIIDSIECSSIKTAGYARFFTARKLNLKRSQAPSPESLDSPSLQNVSGQRTITMVEGDNLSSPAIMCLAVD